MREEWFLHEGSGVFAVVILQELSWRIIAGRCFAWSVFWCVKGGVFSA